MMGADHAEPWRNDQSCVSHASASIDGDLCPPHKNSGTSVWAWQNGGYCRVNKWCRCRDVGDAGPFLPLSSLLWPPGPEVPAGLDATWSSEEYRNIPV